MTNKKISINAVVLLILILAIAISSLGLGFIRGMFDTEFNPETDVCIEFSCCNLEHINNDALCNQNKLVPEYDNECMSSMVAECEEWRPKTKCELNPNDENCVCDEYIIQNKRYCHKITIKKIYCLTKDNHVCLMNYNCYSDNIDTNNCWAGDIEYKEECSNFTLVNTSICIKAHEKEGVK